MFVPFLAATIMGAAAVKFGAISAMLSVLTIAIQILIIALLALGGLRHSAASFLINANHSLYVVQKLLGHTQIKTTARYSHLAPETMLNAVDTMADAAGLGATPVEPAVPPVPPVLRLIGQEEKVAA